MHSEEQPRKYILGIPIDDISMDEAVERCLDFIRTNRQGIVITPNPEICAYGYSRKWFRRALEDADLSVPDSIGLKIGGAILGQSITHRVPGVDLAERLLIASEHNSYSVLFLGGNERTGVQLKKRLNERHPKLIVHHMAGGGFSEDGVSDDPQLVTRINNLKPTIIFVCLGHPRQELFMTRHSRLLSAHLLLGVGGTIDFMAGTVPRAPRAMRVVGLEWLFRLIIQPRRLRRIINATIIFPIDCIRWVLGTLFVYRKNVAAVILNDRDEVLVGKHAIFHYWQIPQGGVLEGESYDDALFRELREEIGTDKVRVLGFKKNAYKYRWPRNSRNFHKYKNRGQVQSVYLLRLLDPLENIRVDKSEFSEFTWIPKDAILHSPSIPEYKKIIIDIGLKLLR